MGAGHWLYTGSNRYDLINKKCKQLITVILGMRCYDVSRRGNNFVNGFKQDLRVSLRRGDQAGEIC